MIAARFVRRGPKASRRCGNCSSSIRLASCVPSGSCSGDAGGGGVVGRHSRRFLARARPPRAPTARHSAAVLAKRQEFGKVMH